MAHQVEVFASDLVFTVTVPADATVGDLKRAIVRRMRLFTTDCQVPADDTPLNQLAALRGTGAVLLSLLATGDPP